MVRQKIKEWGARYLAAEIAGTVTAISAASITRFFSKNLIIIAYAGSLGEAIGFYSTFFLQSVFVVCKKSKTENKRFAFSDLTKIIAGIIFEFGPAGMIDGLVLRPFFMYLFPVVLKNFRLGILVGKFAGDLTFYLLVILGYEIKKHRKNQCTINHGEKNQL